MREIEKYLSYAICDVVWGLYCDIQRDNPGKDFSQMYWAEVGGHAS